MRAATIAAVAALCVSPAAIAMEDGRVVLAQPSFERADRLVAESEALERALVTAGDDLAIFYGVSTVERRASAASRAERIVDVSVRARAALDETVEASARAEAFGGAADPAREARRQDAIHERDVVLPLRIARAKLVVAYAMEEGSDQATEAARLAASVEPVSPWSHASRDIALGLAARVGGAADRSLERFVSARDVVAGADSPALTLALAGECAFGRALALAESGRHASARDVLDAASGSSPFDADPFWSLALADAWMRVGLMEASASSDRLVRLDALRRAFEKHVALARGSAEARMQSVERIATVVRGDFPFADLPGVVMIAWAHAIESLGDEPNARRILSEVLAASSFDRHWRAAAGFRLARMIGDDPDAIEVLLRTAETAEGDDRVAALRAASAIGWAHRDSHALLALESLRGWRDAGFAGSDGDGWRRRLAALLAERVGDASCDDAATAREGLAVVGEITSGVERARAGLTLARAIGLRASACADDASASLLGAWSEAARHAFGDESLDAYARCESAGALLAMGRAEEALRVLDDARAPAEAGLAMELDRLRFEALSALDRVDAIAGMVVDVGARGSEAAWLLDRIGSSLWMRIADVRMSFVDEATHPEAALMVGAFDSLAGWSWDAARQGVYADRAAWASLACGRWTDAARRFEGRIADAGRREDLLLGRAEALRASGDVEAAFALYRAVAQGAEARGEHEGAYWRSWVRMLEILHARDDSEASRARVRVEAERLKRLESAGRYPGCVARLEGME